MKRIKLSSVILVALVTYFIMNYRLSPFDTPIWLFGVIFLTLLLYVVTDLFTLSQKRYSLIKIALIILIFFEVVGSSFVSAIIVRHQSAPLDKYSFYMVHDTVIQQELAMRFLIHGKNPYNVSYFGTPLELWPYSDTKINPALYYFVDEPFYIIFPIPFYFLSVHSIGYFDGRIVLLILFAACFFLALKVPSKLEDKLLFSTLLIFNPATLGYTLEGRSDFFMFAFFLFSLWLLTIKKNIWSAILLGLSFAVKQSVWPAFPFYFGYLYFKKGLKPAINSLIWFSLTFLVFVIPFLIWDSKAFLDSTVGFLSGTVAHSYPISGYGFGALLTQSGWIKNNESYFPFLIFQIALGMPLLIFLMEWLKKYKSINALIASYAIFLFVYWYFSRYFNNSHVAYLSTLFITACFWPEESANASNIKEKTD